MFFSKNSRKFASSPSPALGCYWLYKKLSSIGVYAHIALRALTVSYSDVGEGGDAVKCEKTQFFLNTLYVFDYKMISKILSRLRNLACTPNIALHKLFMKTYMKISKNMMSRFLLFFLILIILK